MSTVLTLPSRLELLVIQPTSLCNLDCRYCYVPERLNAKRIERATLKKMFRLLRHSRITQEQGEIDVLWHAGEPLTVGCAGFAELINWIKEEVGDRWKINHSIQTNGTLINQEWCDLMVRERVSVGLSMDGPKELHDWGRPMRNGEGSHERVSRAVHLFKKNGIPVNVLVVLTKRSIKEPEILFNYFCHHGIRDVAFNVEEQEGENHRSELFTTSSHNVRQIYNAFMRKFLQLNRNADYPLHIREFHSLAQKIADKRKALGIDVKEPEQEAGRILTVTRDGVITTWSPELASGRPEEVNMIAIGNVNDERSIDDMLLSNKILNIQSHILEGIAKCRSECHYFAYCGGGSPSNKFFENGAFESTETVRCALHVKELTDVFIEELSVSQRVKCQTVLDDIAVI